MQKIVYLSTPITSQFGGGEVFLDNFTDRINSEHIFVGGSKAVFDLFQSKKYKVILSFAGFEPVSPLNLLLFPISIVLGFAQFARFFDVLKSADVIISPTSHCETFFVIPWIKFFLHKKIIFMVHSANVPRLFTIPPLNFLLSKCWGNSSVVFVSNSQKELWNSAGCVSQNQIVIYNGVKIFDFEPRMNISDEIKIGFLGRLHTDKGCEILLESLTRIKSSEKIRVIIGGDGPEKESLKAKLSSLNLTKSISVEFVGFVADTKSFLEGLDLFVFPSRRESFGLVICEAMERGVSVLSSDIPSSIEVKSVVNDYQQTALTFGNNNSDDLASKIDYFLQNKNEYLNPEYKTKLHTIIEQNFGFENTITSYQNILD